ncbi:MAG: hypothetical protein ACFCVC_13575 [Acidimicrobiia bacterium]
MTNPDLLILVVGVFVTFMAVWGSVAYGVFVVQRLELSSAQSDPGVDLETIGPVENSMVPQDREGEKSR